MQLCILLAVQEAQFPCGANVKLSAAVVQMYSDAHCFSGAQEELCAAVVQMCCSVTDSQVPYIANLGSSLLCVMLLQSSHGASCNTQ